jgi:hypothetical protein
LALLAAIVALAGTLPAQQIHFNTPAGEKPQNVTLLDDNLTVIAGKPDDLELRFRVGPGLHINSHTPKDELLLPTTLKLDPAGVQVLKLEYPGGQPFHLANGAGEMLDVYQREFRVHLRVVAPKGSSTVTGTLRYQACDTASCFPPRTLPIRIVINGR